MKSKIKIYQADFVFMLKEQAYEFDSSIIQKWGKIIKRKYNPKYGYIYRCQFQTIDDGTCCFIECINNRFYTIAINQKVR